MPSIGHAGHNTKHSFDFRRRSGDTLFLAVVSIVSGVMLCAAQPGEGAGDMNLESVSFTIGEAKGIGEEAGVCRRDLSDSRTGET